MRLTSQFFVKTIRPCLSPLHSISSVVPNLLTSGISSWLFLAIMVGAYGQNSSGVWFSSSDQNTVVGGYFSYIVTKLDSSFSTKASANINLVQPGSGTGSTGYQTHAWDADGSIWLPSVAFGFTTVIRVKPDGQIVTPPVDIGYLPLFTEVVKTGGVVLLSRIGLTGWGPLTRILPDGTIAWQKSDALIPFQTSFYPQTMAVSSGGLIYIGGTTQGACACLQQRALITVADPATGGLVGTIDLGAFLPPPPWPTGTVVRRVAGAPDGSVLVTVNTVTVPGGTAMFRITGAHVSPYVAMQGGFNGATSSIRVDGRGDIWIPVINTQINKLLRLDPLTMAVKQTYDFGILQVMEFALGSSGEELFAVMWDSQASLRRAFRMNTVTGVYSALAADPVTQSAFNISSGDPTGFQRANVIDRNGDSDGDGISNGDETFAPSDPYDPLSQPSGPKAYLTFGPSNVLRVKVKDPDGLFNPSGGLASLSIELEGFGDVLLLLLPFLTNATLTSNDTQLDLEFGALPLPNNLKTRITVKVTDTAGLHGSDWQITPPGYQ